MKKIHDMEPEERQKWHTERMVEVHAQYKEEPLKANNHILEGFIEKIKSRGFNFDPYKVVKMMDAEVEKQYEEIFKSIFSGVHPNSMVDMKNEIIEWHNSEESRFSQFRDAHLSDCGKMHDAQVEATQADAHESLPVAEEAQAEVTPITKAKKGKAKR